MEINTTEFEDNFDKYMDLVSREDVYVTKNRKTISAFSNKDVKDFLSLRGILKGFDYDKKKAREEKIKY